MRSIYKNRKERKKERKERKEKHIRRWTKKKERNDERNNNSGLIVILSFASKLRPFSFSHYALDPSLDHCSHTHVSFRFSISFSFLGKISCSCFLRNFLDCVVELWFYILHFASVFFFFCVWLCFSFLLKNSEFDRYFSFFFSFLECG